MFKVSYKFKLNKYKISINAFVKGFIHQILKFFDMRHLDKALLTVPVIPRLESRRNLSKMACQIT